MTIGEMKEGTDIKREEDEVIEGGIAIEVSEVNVEMIDIGIMDSGVTEVRGVNEVIEEVKEEVNELSEVKGEIAASDLVIVVDLIVEIHVIEQGI
jgi:activator of HSP90 ATPase